MILLRTSWRELWALSLAVGIPVLPGGLLALLTLGAGVHRALAFSPCRSCETEGSMKMSNTFSRRTSGLAPAQ